MQSERYEEHGQGDDSRPVVVFDAVSKHFGPLRAVDGLSLRIQPGESVALLGPNGAGKSTTLDMLLGLSRPSNGSIRVLGRDPYEAVKAGGVGAMLQSGGLMPEVTVRELVNLVTGFHPRPLPVAEVLARAGITNIAERRVDRLSGGQAQRVRFALAIAGKSDLLVLDEPTSAMDVSARQAFWQEMTDEIRSGRTLLFATHYLDEADRVADRILVLSGGQLIADATPEDIKAKAGMKALAFRLEHPEEATLRGLPGVVTIEVHHDVVRIESVDSDRTLYALLEAGHRPRDLLITGLDLERAFLAITAPDPKGDPGGVSDVAERVGVGS
jgi:ABC-2 type transport system ATP-binding protein